MRKLSFLAVLLSMIFVSTIAHAEWIPLKKTNTSKSTPKVTLLEDNSNSTIIRVELDGFELTQTKTDDETLHNIDIFSDIFTTSKGLPELPYIAKILAIPDDCNVSVEVVESGEVFTFQDINLAPARRSWYEGEPLPELEKEKSAYISDNPYPNKQAKMEKPAIFRDFRISRLSVFPMRYIPNKKELEVTSSITIKVNYLKSKGNVVNPKTTPKKAIAPSFAKIYRSSIFNYEQVLEREYGGKEEGEDLMLCIMPDEFVESFQTYAEWKRQSGTDIHITKFSDIGANSSNPVIIKDHITDAYHNWPKEPTHVLIVGDNGVFPIKIVNYDYSFPNEDYFVEIDGEDFFPELMIGRFSNQTDYRLQVMVNKFKKYEKEPYIEDVSWFKKGICCSNNDYISQVATKRFTANVMLEDGQFTKVDTLMSDGFYPSQCSMNLEDVKNAINEGRSYLNYRGEGWSSGWWANCYPFDVSDVSSLNNGEMLTFVTSIGCGVAMFNTSGGNSFGEQWVKLGSLSEIRGGCAFIGPTSNTHTTYNNRIDKGIYVGMFREGMDTPGQAILRGKLYMYNVFGNDPWVEYHYRVFCVLGDPSIHIWKNAPKAVDVMHPTNLPTGNSTHEITVNHSLSGMPVANAQITITGEELFVSEFTDSSGVAQIDLAAETEETLVITVIGGNVYPYQSEIIISQTAEQVGIEEYTFTDTDGNNDGLINPNENGTIQYTLKNWGYQTASNVQATLSTDCEFVDILSSDPQEYGDLGPGNNHEGTPFQFYVHTDCPVGTIIPFDLHITSDNETWDYTTEVEVMGCRLRYTNQIIFDEGSSSMNYRLEPGESGQFYVSIINIGEDNAPNVTGILRTTDPYLTFGDSIGDFQSIAIGESSTCIEDHFAITVDASCPEDYLANVSIELYTTGGSYEYSTIRNFAIPIGKPLPGDITGPDNYGYYGYSSDDTLFDQHPEFDWKEIRTIGTEILVPSQTSDYTTTVDLPFTFKYYGIDYSQVRISTDGWIALGNGSQTASVNHELPYNDDVECMIAPFWDDLYDSWDENGSIYFYYEALRNRFIVEWDNVTHNDFTVAPEDFQIILLDPAHHTTETGDGDIIFQYKDLSTTTSNTVGIENHDQDDGLLCVYNSDYDPTMPELESSLALRFTTEPPSIGLPDGMKEIEENTSKNNNLWNYPNPFRNETTIQFSLHETSNVELTIYDIEGKIIDVLINRKLKSGKHHITWKGSNSEGKNMPAGTYIYELKTINQTYTNKLSILK